MRSHKFAMRWLCLIALAGVPAMADITYNLTVDNCSGGCNPGSPGDSMGTVLLQQNGTNDVKVTVTLVSPLDFVNTGLAETIDFNLGSIPIGVSATNFTNGHFFLTSSSASSNHFDGFGNFGYAIALDTKQGSTGAQLSPVSFDVVATGLTVTSFDANKNGFFFGVDVYNTVNGNTGPIGTGSGTLTLSGGGGQVPEPSSVALLGTAALGILMAFKRRFGRAKQS